MNHNMNPNQMRQETKDNVEKGLEILTAIIGIVGTIITLIPTSKK